MSDGRDAAGSTASSVQKNGDWPTQATDLLVDNVQKARDRMAAPIKNLTRVVILVLLLAVLVSVVMTFSVIAAVRALEIAIDRAWAAHGIVGLVLMLLGALLWSRRPAELRNR